MKHWYAYSVMLAFMLCVILFPFESNALVMVLAGVASWYVIYGVCVFVSWLIGRHVWRLIFALDSLVTWLYEHADD
jgi:hypothetical protein